MNGYELGKAIYGQDSTLVWKYLSHDAKSTQFFSTSGRLFLPMLSLLGFLFVFATAAAAAYTLVRGRRSPRYPPGPKPLPIIGNVKDLPREKEALVYADWFRKYGACFTQL